MSTPSQNEEVPRSTELGLLIKRLIIWLGEPSTPCVNTSNPCGSSVGYNARDAFFREE